ncbi:aa3-type cytochrome oxidase subunit CtaJ [Pseudonocardia bannensis]|uniref:Uncharacterized protein n=1 Tax=Pseudonocardia bannensis TaxID=630973 RepID=A0A848DEX4_9PSEU|nr:hypothetical protein [Pseudonocardia bannensis]NMH91125.1 hypothetical protein [Pseudonocardia bannensis]
MVETVLLFVVPPLALYLLIALLVMAPKMARRPRYRAGQPWSYEPMWWTANPEGAGLPPAHDEPGSDAAAAGGRGGARGNW